MGSTPSGVCVTVWNLSRVTIQVLLSTLATSCNTLPIHEQSHEPDLGIRATDVVVLVGFEGRQHPAFHQLVDDLVRFVLRSVADVNTSGTHQFRFLGQESLHFPRQEMEIALNEERTRVEKIAMLRP